MSAIAVAKRQRKPVPKETNRAFRMSGEYAVWLERYAALKRMNISTLIDVALAELAKGDGFEAPPVRVRKVGPK